MGFRLDWVDGRSIACLESVCKGVLHGSPWENRLTFKLWHLGYSTQINEKLLERELCILGRHTALLCNKCKRR